MKIQKMVLLVGLLLTVTLSITYLAFAEHSCDESPEGTLPFGQKRLTTPWPKINGKRGPIAISLADAGKVTLSWDVGSLIKNRAKIEYEVKFDSNFTVLDKDDPERIKHGSIAGKTGQHSFSLLTKSEQRGTYYIRIAAQNNNGKDVALRSQPVVVYVDPPFGFYDVEIALVPTISGLMSALYPNHITTAYFKLGAYPLTDQKFNPLNIALPYDSGKLELFWETTLEDCTHAILSVKDDKEVIYNETQAGVKVHELHKVGEVVAYIERRGSFDLTSLLKGLKWGREYSLSVHPIDSNLQPAGKPSDSKVMKVFYSSPYLKIKPDIVKGDLPRPKKEIRKIQVTPFYYCVQDDHRKHTFSFSEPMDKKSVESNLTVSPPWPDVQIKWYVNDTEMGYGNLSNLWFDTVYTMTLGTGAKTKTGKKILETPVQWLFKTYPYAEECPEVVVFDFSPKPVLVPPAVSYYVSEDMFFVFFLKNAEDLKIGRIHGIEGYFKDYPKLPGGVFKFVVTGRSFQKHLDMWGQDSYIQLMGKNALGDAYKNYYFPINEMVEVKADLSIKDVSWQNGKFAIHVVNKGPDTIPATHTPYISVDTRFIHIKNVGIADSEVYLNQTPYFSIDFAPNTERIILAKTNDVPEGVVKKHHWDNDWAYALLHLKPNIYLVNDPNKDNNSFKQESPF